MESLLKSQIINGKLSAVKKVFACKVPLEIWLLSQLRPIGFAFAPSVLEQSLPRTSWSRSEFQVWSPTWEAHPKRFGIWMPQFSQGGPRRNKLAKLLTGTSLTLRHLGQFQWNHLSWSWRPPWYGVYTQWQDYPLDSIQECLRWFYHSVYSIRDGPGSTSKAHSREKFNLPHQINHCGTVTLPGSSIATDGRWHLR